LLHLLFLTFVDLTGQDGQLGLLQGESFPATALFFPKRQNILTEGHPHRRTARLVGHRGVSAAYQQYVTNTRKTGTSTLKTTTADKTNAGGLRL